MRGLASKAICAYLVGTGLPGFLAPAERCGRSVRLVADRGRAFLRLHWGRIAPAGELIGSVWRIEAAHPLCFERGIQVVWIGDREDDDMIDTPRR